MRAVRGSCVASPRMDRLEGGGLQREAGGGRRRRAPRLASARPPGRGGRGQGRRRWAGPAGEAGPALVGCTVRPGKLCSFYFFPVLFVLFNIFCHCLQFQNNFIQCQNILKYFMLPLWTIPKVHKTFRSI